jgi:lysozyme
VAFPGRIVVAEMAKVTLPRAILAVVVAGGTAFGIMQESVPILEANPLVAYQDIGGVWTICGGVTYGVKPGDVETVDGCRRRNADAINIGLAAVDRCVTYPMPETRRAAFGLMAYNVGGSAFCKSTAARLANAGQAAQACAQIDRWVYVAGKDCRLKASNCAGIVHRRAIERTLCEVGL